MIAPDSRLVWLVAAVAVPLCALVPFALLPAASGLILLAIPVAVDAVLAARSLRKIGIATGPLLRWFKDRDAKLPFSLENASARALEIRAHFELPAEMEARGIRSFMVPAGGRQMELVIACTPHRRGRFIVPFCHFEVPSPLRLWRARSSRKIALEIQVFPDLRKSRVTALLLARRLTGEQRQRQTGKGREFEKLREYMPGDSYDEIHWKASARRGKPVVKAFQVERTQRIYAIVDTSRLSARSGILENYVNAALTVAITAESQGDRFGLLTFSDRVDRFVPAASGKMHFARCRDAIYTVQPRRVSPDFEELFTFLQLRIRQRSLLLFLTSLDDPLLAESFTRNVRIVARKHLAIVDVPRQEDIRPLFTGAEPVNSADIYRGLAGHMQWVKLRELQRTLRSAGVALHAVDRGAIGMQAARQYLDVKRMQSL
jgi:uncharacterized protein (DUF58 family)